MPVSHIATTQIDPAPSFQSDANWKTLNVANKTVSYTILSAMHCCLFRTVMSIACCNVTKNYHKEEMKKALLHCLTSRLSGTKGRVS